MTRQDLIALDAACNAEIVSAYQTADGWEWKWHPRWPEKAPMLTWVGHDPEEARAVYRQARAIWYKDRPTAGDY